MGIKMKSVVGGLIFGAAVLGPSLFVQLNKEEQVSDQSLFQPEVFYVVWPILIVLLSVVFGILINVWSNKFISSVKNSKNVRIISAILLVLAMGIIIPTYPLFRYNALWSMIITLVMLCLSLVTAFLVASVKKGAGALLAPQIAWLIVASNLAIDGWRKELVSSSKK